MGNFKYLNIKIAQKIKNILKPFKCSVNISSFYDNTIF